MTTNTDIYYHKTVNLRSGKQSLQFRTSQQLFSSHAIDAGTKFLLRTIVEASYPSFKRILDVGCGYGPLGLTLKSLYPATLAQLFDRDALALDYSRQNAALNGLTDISIYGSLGYDDVTRSDFDLIVANLPDHAGETIITYLLREARFHLAPGGVAAVVVVTPLEEMVAKILKDTPAVEIILKRKRSGHMVFHYKFTNAESPGQPEKSSLERGFYHRQNISIRLENLEYKMQTANGLPEFDSLSYGSELLVKALGRVRERKIDNAVVFNPGQGHIAVAPWKLLKPESITIIDRDLLALRYSQLNLKLNGCTTDHIRVLHRAGPDFSSKEKADLILGALREDEGKAASFLLLDKASAALVDKGTIIISGSSTAITRLADYADSKGLLRIQARERRRGYSLLALEKLDSVNKKR